MDKHQQLGQVHDMLGWQIGVRAILRNAFGTDTETRIKATGISSEIANAKEQVEKMEEGATNLLEVLTNGEPPDEVEVELENIIRNL